MNINELAAILNGREYGHEITDAEQKAAKEAGLVVVFGYSDDNLELRGAILDEVGCSDGKVFTITKDGVLPTWERHEEKERDEAFEWFRMSLLPCARIKAIWADSGFSWRYETDIPHAKFNIMENGEKYCRGIVFSINELPA